ncbi:MULTISPECIES: GDSL-type esterase/lipase family protein [Streptomycetaceae]|uniref:SGNH hydrolase-type esterase domain-containing protein n=1 Tax=Streptantibioticus cattleyicolor (strain ATCC 35852 / DSM 46488 / JCM 4925 / NBRC 14057 / NRRL 8057) TaxID=1003195 RepID=F8JUD9_STREN|nr:MULTISPECIES: GDSL-type esterase/lipase family protein [Streptomycetaceae]AEW94349.1 hypothetical protein SCATT_19780 [Streptantibioticus cattleyicolor NRRL 8057 = DSM 46488]MYS58999.1 lipase [Streptomyces sp. SID5468]CCB74706.1 conserved protein of unknown function [Streptantibioticus cattleyicolor NRRL 8057 = DSM 46488]
MARTWHDVPLTGGPVEFRGALDARRTEHGVLPLRLPGWTRAQYPDAFVRGVAEMPAGVRLAFATRARTLELEVHTTVWRFEGEPDAVPPGVFEVYADGEPAGRTAVPACTVWWLTGPRASPRVVPGPAATVRFTLPPGTEQVELWLPQQTPTELVALRADAEVTAPAPDGRRRWVHHGSSISHCLGADGPTGTWPAVAALRGGVDGVNLSLAGNAMLDPFVARVIRDAPADLISLKAGINIVGRAAFRLRTFGPAVHGFLDTVREGHSDTPLLVISPVTAPALEETPGPAGADGDGMLTALGDPADVAEGALTLGVVREELARIVAERRAHDPRLHYLDGRELFGPADVADLPDGLHPNAAATRRMGERFAVLAFGPDGIFG